MRIKLDENLSATLVESLRALGHDADTVVLEGLQGAPDDKVVPAAAEADRLLITLDRGIGALALRLRPEPGVMIVRSRRLDAPGIADDVLHIVQGVRDWQEFKGHVVVADRARLRLHPYPPIPHELTGGSAS